jgi:hypothetical protein
VVPLRPLGVGELLDGAFTLIRRYPAAVLSFAAVVMLVVEVIEFPLLYASLHHTQAALTSNTTTNSGVGVRFGLDGTGYVVGLIVTTLLSGLLAPVVGQAVLGRPMSAGAAWQAARARIGRLLGVTAVVVLIEVAVVAVPALPGAILLGAGATAAGITLLVLGIIAGLVTLVWVTVMLTFAPTALMFEKQGIRAAIARSRLLVRGSWWRTFGIQLLAAVIAGTVSGIISVLFIIAGGLGTLATAHPLSHFTFTALLVTTIGGFLAGLIVRPFTGGVNALLYIDRRMRAEALDLTLQQAAASPVA